MSETVSLKRPRSPSNAAEETDEKYSAHPAAQLLMNQAAMANIPVTSARGVQPVSFPLMQYCQMIQQMQHQQMEFPIGIVRKDKEDPHSASTTPASSRRQTMSNPAMGPRPIRVPPQSLFNSLQFGMIPHPQQLIPPSIDDSQKSPSPTARSQSPHPVYNIPNFQRADEDIYTRFVESVRQLATKLTAERS